MFFHLIKGILSRNEANLFNVNLVTLNLNIGKNSSSDGKQLLKTGSVTVVEPEVTNGIPKLKLDEDVRLDFNTKTVQFSSSAISVTHKKDSVAGEIYCDDDEDEGFVQLDKDSEDEIRNFTIESIEMIQSISAELTASFRSQQENYKLIKEKLQKLLAENVEASKSVDNLFDEFLRKLDNLEARLDNLEAKPDRVFEEEKEAYGLDDDDEDVDFKSYQFTSEDFNAIRANNVSTPIKVIEDFERSKMAGTMYDLYGVR